VARTSPGMASMMTSPPSAPVCLSVGVCVSLRVTHIMHASRVGNTCVHVRSRLLNVR